MAGRGSRFLKDGFNLPKPLIEICGRPFFYWSARSIEKYIELSGITFVVLEEHSRDFGIDGILKSCFPEARIVHLRDVTEGAAVTCLRGVEGLSDDTPVIFNDCDHLFRCTVFNEFAASSLCSAENEGPDGALLTFESSSPAYSYLEFDSAGCVKRTIEKKPVSCDAICGAYYFRSKAVYEKACTDYMKDCEYKEFFLSGVYNSLISSGGEVRGFRTDFHIPFGIPEEYEEAEKEENLKYFEELI